MEFEIWVKICLVDPGGQAYLVLGTCGPKDLPFRGPGKVKTLHLGYWRIPLRGLFLG